MGANMRRQDNFLAGYRALTESSPPENSNKKRRINKNTEAAQSIIEHYLRMDKALVESSEASELVDMADRLEEKDLNSPNTSFVRGWMLAEASLAGDEALSWEERTELLDRAETAFDSAVKPIDKNKLFTDYRYRIALAIAHLPLIRAIVDGDVASDVQESVTEDVLEIGNTISDREHLSGLTHEISMMALIHMMKDPRYITIPSTYRGGNGTYHKSQTHDLSLIKQHYGTIRQVQPIEVKTHVSDDHRQRYWSTLLSSEAVISSLGGNPIVFNKSMLDVFNERASEGQIEAVQVAMDSLIQSLKNYRITGRPQKCAFRTATRFYGRNQFIAV